MRWVMGWMGCGLFLFACGCGDSNRAAIKQLERSRLEKQLSEKGQYVTAHKVRLKKATAQTSAAELDVDVLRDELAASNDALKSVRLELEESRATIAELETLVADLQASPGELPVSPAGDSESDPRISQLTGTITALRAEVQDLTSRKKLLEDTLADVKITLGEMRQREKKTRDLQRRAVPGETASNGSGTP